MSKKLWNGRSRKRVHGFTLIELLVVISIIALLVSLLLPAMVGARKTGQRIACMATMRQIATAAASYAAEYDDQIIGAPSTSGSTLVKMPGSSPGDIGSRLPIAAGPAVQRWDWMGPMAEQMGIPVRKNSGALPDLVERFNDLRRSPAFLCKSNNFLASRFEGPVPTTDRMISYNTQLYQMYILATSGKDAGFPMDSFGTSWYNNSTSGAPLLPTNWRPYVTRLGVAANKVFCADGARYSRINEAPTFNSEPHTPFGGSFCDAGPCWNESKGYDRSYVPGNFVGIPARSTDARVYAYRHATGAANPGAPGNAYKLNLVFYDGHAETQGDLQSTNPHQWYPKDSTITTAFIQKMWNDSRAYFGYTTPFAVGP